jgi:hypothetical protein
VPATAFNGASESTEVTRDGAKRAFYNRRAEVWWRFREALDPDQEGGSAIALPPDDELKADVASAQWELTARGIKLTRKQDIRERIGRSPGKGDAVVMAWAEGAKAVKRLLRRSRPIEIQGASGYDPHTAADIEAPDSATTATEAWAGGNGRDRPFGRAACHLSSFSRRCGRCARDLRLCGFRS